MKEQKTKYCNINALLRAGILFPEATKIKSVRLGSHWDAHFSPDDSRPELKYGLVQKSTACIYNIAHTIIAI